MTFRFSQRSLSLARRVDPALMAVAALALSRSGVDFGITEEQSRTIAQQREKVRRGVSKTMNSLHVIKAGESFSTALDLVPYVDGRYQWGDSQWRIRTEDGETIHAFAEIAEAMRSAAVELDLPIKWGGVWDRRLNDLPAGVDAMRQAVEDYKARHPGPDFIDGPHFEIVR